MCIHIYLTELCRLNVLGYQESIQGPLSLWIQDVPPADLPLSLCFTRSHAQVSSLVLQKKTSKPPWLEKQVASQKKNLHFSQHASSSMTQTPN